jgi:DNA-3-methyladenine glycosylase
MTDATTAGPEMRSASTADVAALAPASPLTPLAESFFRQSAVEVARQILGTVMTRRVGDTPRRARVVEAEAYLGPRDLASHSSKGRTKRTDVMFGPPGRAYVYFIYGMHQMFNIVVGEEGRAEAVLLRAAQPLDGWDADLLGPGRLARAFAITAADNRMNLGAGDITFLADPQYRARVVKTKRVGVDYAGRWKDRLLRFIDANNPVAARLRY